ncbi:MAG: hypothetical protein AAGG48_28535 [Planctomycetota bacterium]
MATWTHPTLGEFEYDEIGWIGEISLPGMRHFYRDAPADFDWAVTETTFESESTDKFPSEQMIAVAIDIFANNERLISDGVRILFDDIAGTGPNSGMWWHSALAKVNEKLAGESMKLDDATDLFEILDGPSIFVQESGCDFDRACGIIEFHTPIDEEHGVGWLTDGNKILGTGYRNDTCVTEGL